MLRRWGRVRLYPADRLRIPRPGETEKVIRAFGELFQGSLAAAMGGTPYVPPAPDPCYWYAGCGNPATTTRRYPELGDVDVCESCACIGETVVQTKIRRTWGWIRE